MQEACDANPGTMYSILGLEDEQVEQACCDVREEGGGQVWPANYNCPGQVVISGDVEAAGRAAELCEERGARRAIQLSVAGAFHSPFMDPAADKLEQELNGTALRTPNYPVVSNVAGEPGEDPDEIRDLLHRQLTSPVHWAECMNWFLERGVRKFYEVGAGSVLRGLLRRIDRDADCVNVRDADGVREMAEDLS
jgi:[acyl-carrier-protein] S-malonyltransferase